MEDGANTTSIWSNKETVMDIMMLYKNKKINGLFT